MEYQETEIEFPIGKFEVKGTYHLDVDGPLSETPQVFIEVIDVDVDDYDYDTAFPESQEDEVFQRKASEKLL